MNREKVKLIQSRFELRPVNSTSFILSKIMHFVYILQSLSNVFTFLPDLFFCVIDKNSHSA